MTGTSLDGLDAVLAKVHGRKLDLSPHFVGMIHRPLGTTRDTLYPLANGEARPPIHYMRAARALGELHADAVAELCDRHLPRDAKLDLAVAHGQTICHAPPGQSWQLLDPWPIVRRLQVPVVYDLRQADLVAGGQGAPITPLADSLVYKGRTDLVVNLGGICNITDLTNRITGFDICPCNLLIDRVVQRLYPPMRFDHQGNLAATGRADPKVFQPLFDELSVHRGSTQSLGREDCGDDRIEVLIKAVCDELAPNDIVASAVESVAQTIASFIGRRAVRRAILAGGGTKNAVLVRSIRGHCPARTQVLISDDLGIPAEAREALCFAVLGALAQDQIPISLAGATGATNPGRAGAWVYP